MTYNDAINSTSGSIADALEKLQSLESVTINIVGKDPESGERQRVEIPRYLFRGEGGTWGSTVSAMERVRRFSDPFFSKLEKEEYQEFFRKVEEITSKVDEEIQNWLNLPPMQSKGLLQHYEMPTDFIDFTSNLKTAVGFSVFGHKAWVKPQKVTIGVLDMQQAHNKSIVADFASLIDIARRPVRQEAYGFFSRSHVDLKARAARKELGISWHSAIATQKEAADYELKADLLDLRSDEACGYVDLVLRHVADKQGGWPKEVARFLSERVAAAPFVAKRVPNSDELEVKTIDEVGLPFDEKQYRLDREEEWSKQGDDQ